jgi:hypothetical protein
MRKIVLLFIFSIFSISCLKFEESDLDPNRPFSIFLGLSRIGNIQNTPAFEVSFSTRESATNEFLGPFNAVRLTKVEDDYELPPIDTFDDTTPDGENRGVFFYEYGAYTVRFRELGTFRADFYNLSGGSYSGSILFEINSNSQNLLNIIADTVIANLSWEALPIRQFNSTSPFVRLGPNNISNFVKVLDSSNQRSFVIGEYLFNELSYMDSNGTNFINYPILHYTEDGISFSSVPIYEIPIRLSIGSMEEKLDISNSITFNGDLYAILNRKILSTNFINYSALLRIPISNPEEYELIELSPREPANEAVTASGIGIAANRIIYEEVNSGGTAQIRFEEISNGIFGDPGSNSFVSTPQPGDPFVGSNITDLQFSNGVVIRQVGFGILSRNSSFMIEPETNISAGTCASLGASDFVYKSNSRRSFLLRFDAAELGYCIDTIPDGFVLDNVNFDPGRQIDLTKGNTVDPVSIAEKSNSNFSILNINIVDVNRFFRYPHADVPGVEFGTNTQEFRPLPDYSESAPKFDGFGLLEDSIITYKRPIYTSPLLAGQILYDLVFSQSSDGSNWSEWRAIDINIAPPPQ